MQYYNYPPPHTHTLAIKVMHTTTSYRTQELHSQFERLSKNMLLSTSIVLLFLAHSSIAQQQDSLPVQLPQVDIEGRNDGTCPSAEVTEQARNSTKEEIRSILRDTVVPILNSTSSIQDGRCPCGGPGQWRRIAHLNLSDTYQQCPPYWQLINTPVRGAVDQLPQVAILPCSR